ncbi:MAG TPA: CvpA family protein [Phycisphaerae bacterium]|nr:CvpA family protein [Phycisphaerae bacterium]
MIFSIVVALMVILVTAFWVYQGFFSSAIMFLCTVIACLLAFGFYEQVHSLWAANLNAGIGLPLALMLIFLVTLLVLRLGTDKMIPDGVKLPVIADRAGGGVCGLFTGLLLVGTSLVAIQMLPIGSSVLGFERVSTAADGSAEEKGFMLKPDGFTIGLVNMLSSGSFQGETSFADAKPDFIEDLYSARANPQPEERVFVPQDSLQVKGYWEARQIDQVSQRVEGEGLAREFTTVEPSVGKKFLVCRVRLDTSAAAEGSMDLRFRVPQFRIVGPPPASDGASAPPSVHLACGMSDLYIHKDHGLSNVKADQAARLVRFGPQTDFLLNANTARSVAEIKGSGENASVKAFNFDVAFEVPENFSPWYVEYKRGARVELTKKLQRTEPPSDAATAYGSSAPKPSSPKGDASANDTDEADEPEKKDSKPKVGKPTGGNVHIADAIEARTGVFDTLPTPLPKDNSFVARHLQGDVLGECHFYLDLPGTPPTDGAVTKFYVPEGKRMVQVGADKKDALSLFGRALNYATNVAAQIRLTDSEGTDYFAIGVYSAAPVGGKMVFEVQYYPESEQPERSLKKAKKLTENVLRSTNPEQRLFGYLFLVDPGVKIVSFSSGARNAGKQTLEIDVPQ